MKSAYELAMERLNRESPAAKLTAAQKRQIAELDSRYKARMAEREIALQSEMDGACTAGNMQEAETLRQQWIDEKRKLTSEWEEKKEAIRAGA